jgi:uncharacterized membrane protein YqjE
MDEKESPTPSLPETLRRLGATVLAIFSNRLELLVVELQEERIRFLEALFLVAVVMVLSFFTLTLAAIAVTILIWKEFGIWGLVILSGVGLVGTLLAAWGLRARLRNWPLLAGTLAELRKDHEWLESK